MDCQYEFGSTAGDEQGRYNPPRRPDIVTCIYINEPRTIGRKHGNGKRPHSIRSLESQSYRISCPGGIVDGTSGQASS